jgi:hypothetical protein
VDRVEDVQSGGATGRRDGPDRPDHDREHEERGELRHRQAEPDAEVLTANVVSQAKNTPTAVPSTPPMRDVMTLS